MTKIMKQLLTLLTVFFVLLSQFEISVRAVETEYVGVEVGLEIDDSIGAITADFDHIDRFNEYGIAIIVKDTYNDNNELVKRYGLINNLGEVVLDPIYSSIIDYNANYFSVMNYGGNVFEEGIASKRDGSIVVPVKYNYIPNMDGNGVYTLQANRVIDDQMVWTTDLYSYFDGVISQANVPEGFVKEDYKYLWANRIYPDVYQVSAYREIQTEQGTQYENITWLSNSRGHVIFYSPFAYIQDFHKLNDAYYFVANSFSGNIESSTGGLFKLTFVDNEPVVTTLLNPNDFNSIWMDTSVNEVEAYRVVNNQWIKGRYQLETGWVGADAFGVNQKETFPYWGNPKFNMTMECTINEDNSRDCVHYLSLATDPTNANLFGNKKYTYVMTTQFNEFITVSDEVTKKSNIFVNKDGKYFLAFEEDLDGWLWVDQNYFVRVGESTIDLKNIDGPITMSDSRVINYGNYQDYGADVSQFCNYQEQKCELIDRKTQNSILGVVNYLYGSDLSNGYLTGTYSILSSDNQSVLKAYIYDTTNRLLVFNELGREISSVNDQGYLILGNSSGIKSLLYKDGTVLIPDTDLNHSYETHFDRNIVIGLSNAKNLYLLDGKSVTSYMGQSTITVSNDAPVFIQKEEVQKYIFENSEIDTSEFTKIGSFVDGYAYVQDEMGIYRVDSTLENKVVVDDVIDFKGAIVQTELGFEYRDETNNVVHPIDIDGLDRVKQFSEFFYLYSSLAGPQFLFVYDKSNKELIKYDSASQIAQDMIYPEYYHFYYTKDNLSFKALLKSNGELIDSTLNGVYELKSNYIIRYNNDNSVSLLRYDGTNFNAGTDFERVNNFNYAYGNFYNLYKTDGTHHLVFFDGIQFKVLGDYNLDYQIVANSFVRVYRYDEGTVVDPDWDSDDVQIIGLYDLNGNVILDPTAGYIGFNINDDHQLLEAYFKNTSYVGSNPSAGIMDFSGKLIPELVGYSSENQLVVSDEGELRIRKPMGLKRYYDFTNNDGIQMQGYEDAYIQNVYNVTNRKIVFPFDFVNKSSITHNKFYTLAVINDAKLESEISPDQLNQQYSGDVYYDDDNNRIRVKYGQVYLNLQNEIVFDQSAYSRVNFDGLNFIAEKYDEESNTFTTDLVDEFGNLVLSGFSNIWKSDDLAWYLATSSKSIPNPYGDDWNLEIGITKIIDVKTLNVLPYNFEFVNIDNLKRDGYGTVAIYTEATRIEDVEFDSAKKYGVLRRDGTFLVEPRFDNISEFTRTGNALAQKIVRSYECTYTNELNQIITQTCSDYKQGLINNEVGLILEAEYDAIESTNPTRMSWNTPNFDLNGHVKIVNYVQGDAPDMWFRNVGLANVNGPLFEGAVYQYAYYKNGYYYLKKFNDNWKVVNGSNFDDVIEVVVPRVVEGASVNAIELIGDYVIATQLIYDETFDKTYEYVGVLNRSDMSLFIDFDYSSIKFEEGLFYLELYNTSLGTTQQAVMNEQKEFVVPFNNKYDSISEYVDGYAIGQSGTKEPESTGANPVVNLLSTFFLDVSAANDDFVLEVIDENGKVVGDLSEQYESATLLGTVDGVTKALVKKDGKFYIATLIEKPIALIPITGVTLNTQTSTLNVGETFHLIGTILPNDANEPARIEWSSLNSDVASVDVNGVVKALKAGTTTISFKVNNFEAVATIIVKSTITGNTPNQDTVSTIVDAIIQSNPNLKKSEQNAVVNDVENLVDYLNGDKNINDMQLLKTIQSVFDLNPNFSSQLNEEEALVFDEVLNRLFKDAFTIDVTNSDIKHQIDGLLLALNILPLLDGEDLTIRLNISESISKKDEPILTSYIEKQNYDEEFIYTLDIELIQVLNELETVLSDLNRPVKLTFALPDRFVGIGELKVLRIHNGVVTELPVTLNPNYTFSFETDQFSSFTLVKATPVSVITDTNTDNQSAIAGFNWLYAFVVLIIVVAGALGMLVFKRKVQV